MPRQINLNISLEPIVQHDMGTDNYILFYKEFPEAFAQGRTIEEAENNLIPLLELMWREKPDYTKTILERYLNDSHRKNPTIVVDPKNE